jgi:hypothetical protein
MTLGRFVVDVIKTLVQKKIDIIDIPRVDDKQAIVVIPDGTITCRSIDNKHFNLELHKDRIYVGVESCTKEEVKTTLEFLLQRFERIKEFSESETKKS